MCVKSTRHAKKPETTVMTENQNPGDRSIRHLDDTKRLCSFWTPFFAVLPRFLIPAIPVALVSLTGFYGAFYRSGISCAIGWIALVLGTLVELFLVSVFISGCRRMQKITRSTFDALESPEVAAVTRETLAKFEAENKK
jgi:hypothetical protein